MPEKIPTLKDIDQDTEREIIGILYALQLIRRETGHGTIVIIIRDGKAVEMKAEHEIRPKYLNPPT
jgi:hypothetical protein